MGVCMCGFFCGFGFKGDFWLIGRLCFEGVGLRSGIGVFIWSTSSEEDRLIEDDEPRVGDEVVEGLRNGSGASF